MSTRIIGPLLCSLLLAMSTAAFAQPAGNRHVIRLASASQETAVAHVGIMGEVARPGVYESTADSLALQTLVRRAGGLTSRASGGIRIIHSRRAGQQVYFSPQLDMPLSDGDLLVVEGQRSVAPLAGDSQRAEAALPPVQIAFVGLLSRPVVEKMSGEQATVRGLLQRLGQHPGLESSLQIIEPAGASRPHDRRTPDVAYLPSGSVLLFDPDLVNRARLPEFTRPYPPDAGRAEAPAPVSPGPADMPRLMALPLAMSESSGEQQQAGHSPPQPQLAGPPALRPSSSETPVNLIPPALAHVPSTATEQSDAASPVKPAASVRRSEPRRQSGETGSGAALVLFGIVGLILLGMLARQGIGWLASRPRAPRTGARVEERLARQVAHARRPVYASEPVLHNFVVRESSSSQFVRIEAAHASGEPDAPEVIPIRRQQTNVSQAAAAPAPSASRSYRLDAGHSAPVARRQPSTAAASEADDGTGRAGAPRPHFAGRAGAGTVPSGPVSGSALDRALFNLQQSRLHGRRKSGT